MESLSFAMQQTHEVIAFYVAQHLLQAGCSASPQRCQSRYVSAPLEGF